MNSKTSTNKILLLAHRGVMGLSPENTFISFKLAKIFGFDGVELDLHMSKDQQLVIIHDESTLRTAKEDFLIKDTTLKELKKLNFAAFWHYELPKQEILTLEEFFENFIDDLECVNIELKTDVYDYPKIEELLAIAIKKLSENNQKKIVISSFNFNSLARFHQIFPQIQTAFLFYKIKALRSIPQEQILSTCTFLNPQIFLYFRFKNEIDAFKKPYIFWTINSSRVQRKALKVKNAAAIICNQRF